MIKSLITYLLLFSLIFLIGCSSFKKTINSFSYKLESISYDINKIH